MKTIATGDHEQVNALGFLLKAFAFAKDCDCPLSELCWNREKKIYLHIKRGTRRGSCKKKEHSYIAIVSSKKIIFDHTILFLI